MLFYLLSLSFSAQYAILYAGSNGFSNYRHQADIFTIYNQLLSRGFTQENICLYAYDDIASNIFNPYKGQIFHSIDHKLNVYPGSSIINYKGDEVNSQGFYDSISKLPTTESDYVFIYYDNHGGPGTLGTPDFFDIIEGNELSNSFNIAVERRLYKQCLFIIEACYSGSVAELINASNLAIITAANAHESSYSAIYDEEIGTYLSNEFTNYFISIIDENPSITVGELFLYLQKNTEQSHICFYGDESIQSISLSKFIGIPTKVLSLKVDKTNLKSVKPRVATEKSLKFLSKHPKASIRSFARLEILRIKANTEKLETILELIVNYVDKKNFDEIMNDKKAKITKNYFDVLRVFLKKFGEINPDDLGKLRVLVSLAAKYSKTEIIQAIFALI